MALSEVEGGPATAIGTPVNNGISNKAVIKARIEKIRSKLLTAEEIYYSYRCDMENSLAEVKYQLDKLEKFIGEQL